MCGRYTQGKAIPEVISYFVRRGLSLIASEQLPLPSYNIAPSARAPVVFHEDDTLFLAPMQWGFVPHWAKALDELKSRPINARSEGAESAPFFRDAFKQGRCLIPATGFYEWQGNRSPKQPWFIHAVGEPIVSFAGLWSRWRMKEEELRTFAILTTDANETMQSLHHRMPCILRPEDEARWLGIEAANSEELKGLLRPCSSEYIALHPVSTAVNRPGMEGPQLILPIELPEERGQQGDLFGGA
jgi:putative SOS response-associated peptidase YedK